MNFYEMGLLLEFNKEEFMALAERIFGACRESGSNAAICKFKNRNIELDYYHGERLVGISFLWAAGERPGEVSAKDPHTYGSGREVQSGTIEGIRKFKEFAQELKKRNIGIIYVALGRREKLYDRIMKQAGMRQSGGGEWR